MHNHWGKVKMKGRLTKHLSCKCCTAFNGKHKINNHQKTVSKEIDLGIKELDSKLTYDLKQDIFFRSLFPDAQEIICYEHYIVGEVCVSVDGVHKGYMQYYDELNSFVYFTGTTYKDIDDLADRYYSYLEENEKFDWLP